MLQATSSATGYCLHRAAQCDRLALEANDSDARANYERVARNWRFLASNRQYVERFELFLQTLPKDSIRFHPTAFPDKSENWKDIIAHDAHRRLDDLEFRLHLWNDTKTQVETLLAATRNTSIGYAALHAAAREYPDRRITLSRGGKVVYTWEGREA